MMILSISKMICNFFSLASCQSDTLESKERKLNTSEDQLIRINQKLVSKESSEIDSYVLKNSLKMQSTGTGLRYMITVEGRGMPIDLNEEVSLHFRISELSGALLSASAPSVPLRFKTGAGQAPKGLEEAVLLMKRGSHAKLILPAHLGFGLEGSGDIKPATTLVYEIEILNN
jgi:FKBP-type peptidyl-prolyl cis-trans isomerase